MTQENSANSGSGKAAWRSALALALLMAAAPMPLRAQDALPSVNEYRLPRGSVSPAPRARPQGPVDPENPVATAPRAVQPATPAAAAPSAAPEAAPSATTSPAARPSAPAPRASASPGPRPTAAPSAAASNRPASAAPAASPSPTASALPSAAPAPTPSARATGPTSEPAPVPTAPPVEWRVHSANATKAAQAWWASPWLIALALFAAAALAFAGQSMWRKRRAAAAELTYEDEPAQTEFAPQPAPAPVAPELDLLTAMAEPLPDAPQPAQTPAPAPAGRPVLDVHVNPLQVDLAARRLSATLINTVLNYELVVRNTGNEPIGPVSVEGDMIGAHASMPSRAQLELPEGAATPLHRVPRLNPGESAVLTGEFKLALAEIIPILSGNVALFVPLARFRIAAARGDAPPLIAHSAFVIGEDQERPGAALRPFRLDLGPRLYSRIGQRALALSA